MPTASTRTTGNVLLTDPAPATASIRTTGSVLLNDPGSALPSARTTGSVTLADAVPISGPRVWSHSARVWRPALVRHHSPGTDWE